MKGRKPSVGPCCPEHKGGSVITRPKLTASKWYSLVWVAARGGHILLVNSCCSCVRKGRDCIQGFLGSLKPVAKLRLGPSLLPPSHLCVPSSVFRGQGWGMGRGRVRECLYLILKWEGYLQWYSSSVLLLMVQDSEYLFFFFFGGVQ